MPGGRDRDRWGYVNLPKGLLERVDRIVARTGLWNSRADFVRDAVRAKLREVEGQWD